MFEKIGLAVLANKKDLAASEKSTELLKEIDLSLLQLRKIKYELLSDIEQRIKIQAEVIDGSILDELNAVIKDLQQKLDDNNSEVTALTKENQQLQNTITTLKPITEILEKINVLNEKINTFAQKRSNFMIDKTLFNSVSELKVLQKELAIQIKKEEADISKLDNAGDYKANFKMINQVITATNERLTRKIKEKFNTDILQQFVESSEEKLNKLNQSYATLVKMITKEGIQSLLDNYSDLAQSLKENQALLTDLHSQFSVLQETYYSQEINTKLKSLEQLQTNAEQCGLNLADELITLFTACGTQATLFNIKIPDESKTRQQENDKKLAEIRKFVSLILPDNGLVKLSQTTEMCVKSGKIGDKIEAVKQAKNKALKQLELNEWVNNNLSIRIAERVVTIQNLTKHLDDYAKNNISEECIEFIKSLKKKLEAYQDSGDSSEIKNTIGNNISRFHCIHLHALFNKIKITVIDLNRKIPVDYYQPESEVSSEKLHKQAQDILILQSAKNMGYKENIKALYTRINSMKAYGPTLSKKDNTCSKIVVDLADKLKNDLDRFVVANKNELPSAKAYEKFKDEFSARLHSEDSAMSKHRSIWKPILANVLIGLLTVGFALGIKLIYSGMTTKRCSFFFEKTERQKQISSIDMQLIQM